MNVKFQSLSGNVDDLNTELGGMDRKFNKMTDENARYKVEMFSTNQELGTGLDKRVQQLSDELDG